MKTVIALLILALPCAAQTRYVTSVQNTDDRAQLDDLAGAANVVFVVASGTQVPVVADSGLNKYELLAQQGRLSVWVALNVDGTQDTVMVQNALAFAVAEYAGVKTVSAHGESGAGFLAGMLVTATGPASLSWALDVYSTLSWPFRGPAVTDDGQSMLNGKFVVGDQAMNAGMVDVQVPITSCNVGGGEFHMIVLELQ